MPNPTVRDSHVDQLMTMLSIAYRNEDYIASRVFPPVQVQKKTDLILSYEKSAWFRNDVGQRGPGTEAQEGEYGITSASYICLSYAISKIVPDEVRQNSDAPLRPDMEAAAYVANQLDLAREYRVAAKTTGGSGLWTYSTTPGTAWSDDTSDPLGDMEAAVNGIISVAGVRPNVGVMSWGTWRYLKNHPDILDRIKFTRPGANAQPTDLAGWLGLNEILIGTALYDPAGEGATASPTFIWGDQFWCGYVPPTPGLMRPAAGYVFEWGGRKVNRFRLDTRYSDRFDAQEYTAEVICASDAGAVLYNVV